MHLLVFFLIKNKKPVESNRRDVENHVFVVTCNVPLFTFSKNLTQLIIKSLTCDCCSYV